MHSSDGGPSKDNRAPNPVGIGRIAYDPIGRTWWYYGYGKAIDQGGTYAGPTNFGIENLETFLHLLKSSLEFAQPDIERLTLERVNEGNDKGPV